MSLVVFGGFEPAPAVIILYEPERDFFVESQTFKESACGT